MTNKELLAIAVLKGDEAAALVLADLVLENERQGVRQIPPLRQLNIPIDRLRCVIYLHPNTGVPSEAMVEGWTTLYRNWLRGSEDPLIVSENVNRLEFYEMPSPPIQEPVSRIPRVSFVEALPPRCPAFDDIGNQCDFPRDHVGPHNNPRGPWSN